MLRPAGKRCDMRFFMLMTVFITGLGTVVSAASVLGTWQTGPDKKGQVAHVEARPCGEAVCGWIVRSYDAEGKPITTANIGKRVFWNMTPVGDGEYRGRAWVPAHDREYAARMALEGRQLTVSGCVGPFCQSQVWSRVE
ncbi:MAG: DUF2147 domain-containing protein [Roseovarius sp.]|nr:DUF2147 domain-containing protein [Roseovarius sp.]